MSSNHSPALPADVAATLSTYLRLADQKLPARITGLYLTGSIALNDYHPGQSDIDFVAVTDTTLLSEELGRLGRLHRELRRLAPRPKLDGVYVTWLELQTIPIGLSAPYCLDGRFAPCRGFAANPVTWCMLQRHAISLRGPARPLVRHDDALLRQWCRENLQSYWSEWVQRARTRFLRRLVTLSRRATVWGVLGVTRLHATIRTGEILSKSATGTYALEAFPSRWSRVIHDALRGRLGDSAASYRDIFARRRDTLAFMEYVIVDALRLPS